MGVHAERLAILCDRVVETAHLEQEFSVGIIRIGIVRDQRDVLLERLLRIRVVPLLTVGVTENVVDRRKVGSNLGGFLVMSDRLLIFLLAKIIVSEIEKRT